MPDARDITERLRSRAWDDRHHRKYREEAANVIEKLRAAMTLAIDLIDRNLYHQREKVEDASSVLKQALDE